MAKTWTEKDVEFLRENYRILSIEEISLKLNRTPHSIEVKASKIGIRKTKKWTQKDIKFLKENYNLMSNPELGSALEVSVGSIERKANEYGLRKSKEAMKKLDKDGLMKTLDILERIIRGCLLRKYVIIWGLV